MSRYKCRTSARAIEKDFPHIVEMIVPPGGLGKRLNEIHDFHARPIFERFRGLQTLDLEPQDGLDAP
jgi:hypothetical protein